MEYLIRAGVIKENVVAQIGNTKFETKLPTGIMQLIKFTTPSEMERLLEEASFVITHGGVGTIIQALNLYKKIIAVPRLKKYREHVNDHQLQIIKSFNEKGYIIGVNKVEDLQSALGRLYEFNPKKYVSNNEKFVKKLEKFI